jgi:hypothetical protein
MYLWYPLGVGQGLKQTYLYLWYPLFTTDTDRFASYLDLHIEINDITDTDMSASYLDLHLEIKDTTDTDMSASYLDLHLEMQTYLYLLYPLFQGVGQGMNQTYLYLWYPLFQGVGQGMKQTRIPQIQIGLLHTLTYTLK